MSAAPHSLLGRVNPESRAGLILRRLLAYHPVSVSRSDLMEGAGIRPNLDGPVCASASLAWNILRINDELPLWGWRVVVDGDRYRLEGVAA